MIRLLVVISVCCMLTVTASSEHILNPTDGIGRLADVAELIASDILVDGDVITLNGGTWYGCAASSLNFGPKVFTIRGIDAVIDCERSGAFISTIASCSGGIARDLSVYNATTAINVQHDCAIELTNILVANSNGNAIIISKSQSVKMVSVTITTSTAAVLVTDNAAVIFTNCSFVNTTGTAMKVSGSKIVLEHSRFVENAATNGAALHVVMSTVDCSRTKFIRNSANNGNGTILIAGPSSMTCTGCVFDGNGAKYGGCFYSNALESSVNLTLTDCTLKNNRATVNGGVAEIISVTLNIVNSTFDNNTAVKGGAVSASGGAVSITAGSILTRNRAARGGAICGYGILMNMDHVSVSHNDGGEGVLCLELSRGMSLSSVNFTFNTVRSSVISLTSSPTSDSELIELSYFESNTCDQQDCTAGIDYSALVYYDNHNHLYLSDCVFFNNTGVQADGAALQTAEVNVLIERTVFTNNIGYNGGAINAADTHLLMTNVTVSNNVATEGAGGGIAARSCFACRLTYLICSNNSAPLNTGGCYRSIQSDMVFENSRIHDNSADGGGGIHQDSRSETTLVQCELYNNNARIGGAIKLTNVDSYIEVINSSVYNNTASLGGGVVAIGDVVVVASGCEFYNNSAGVAGLFAVSSSELRVKSSLIHDNSATSSSVLNADTDSLVSLTNVTVMYNMASNGTLAVSHSSIQCDLCNISFNVAGYGAGLYGIDSTLTVMRSTLSYNRAHFDGGACVLDRSRMFLKDHSDLHENVVNGLICSGDSSVDIDVSSSIIANAPHQYVNCKMSGDGVIADEYLQHVDVPGMVNNVIYGGMNVTITLKNVLEQTCTVIGIRMGSLVSDYYVQTDANTVIVPIYARRVDESGTFYVQCSDRTGLRSRDIYTFPREHLDDCDITVTSGPMPKAVFTGTYVNVSFALSISCHALVEMQAIYGTDVTGPTSTSSINKSITFPVKKTCNDYGSVVIRLKTLWPTFGYLPSSWSLYYYPQPTNLTLYPVNPLPSNTTITICGIRHYEFSTPTVMYNDTDRVSCSFSISNSSCIDCPFSGTHFNCATHPAISVSLSLYESEYVHVGTMHLECGDPDHDNDDPDQKYDPTIPVAAVSLCVVAFIGIWVINAKRKPKIDLEQSLLADDSHVINK